MLTYRDLLDESAHRIELRDAQGLLAHVSGRDRTWLFAHPEAPAEQATAARFRDLCTRRAAGEPLQYLTGVQEFYGLALRVTPDVLIPRPETEHLVEAVELWATQLESGELLQMADVGTGSGAIAIALATHVGHVRLTAIDHSAAALAIARENAQAHSCADRITFLENDLLSGIPAHSFDAVVSNPPYIPSGDAATLQREVVAHEPHTALFAGDYGLDVYRRLIPQAHNALKPHGLLALEFGFGQRDALAELLAGWTDVRFLDDYAGIPRVVLAKR
jgi:release factor glutamine methyltransferase